jgi:hypothetical protein
MSLDEILEIAASMLRSGEGWEEGTLAGVFSEIRNTYPKHTQAVLASMFRHSELLPLAADGSAAFLPGVQPRLPLRGGTLHCGPRVGLQALQSRPQSAELTIAETGQR